MFNDYAGLKTTELRSIITRLTSAFICAILFPFCSFFSRDLAYLMLAGFVIWCSIQWPVYKRQTDVHLMQRMSQLNFWVDFVFVTAIAIDNGSDPYWAAYTVYMLLWIEALILFGTRGGLIITILSFIVTAGVSYYRVNSPNLHDPLYAAFYRLALMLTVGLLSTYTLSRFWFTARQSASTSALDELNRNLIASENMTETQFYRRVEVAVRKLMRADSFMLALFPTPLDFELSNINKLKTGDLLPAIVTINHRLLSSTTDRQGWQGNQLIQRCLVESGPVQEYIANSGAKHNTVSSWFAQYNDLPGFFLYTPLVEDGKVLGVMGVQKKTRRRFDLNNVALFEQLAVLCATSLHNVRIVSSQHRRISELDLLNQVSFDLARTKDLSDLVVKLRLRLLNFFTATNVRFVLELTTEEEPEPEANLRIGTLEGITATGIHKFELTLLKTLMQRQESLLIADLSLFTTKTDIGFEVVDNQADKQTVLKGSYLAVPLLAEGEVLGILAVHHNQSNRYFASDLKLLETIAHQTSTVIQNLHLQRQTLRNLKEVQELYHILKSKEGELRLEAEERARFEGAVMTARAISHEIGQPLTAILGLVSLARAGSNRFTARDLEILEEETLQAREILAKLRSVVRFETKPYADQTPMLDLEASSRSHTAGPMLR